ncbi:MAG: hypothetical protein ACLVJ6_02415 [Merdibacter sp.]
MFELEFTANGVEYEYDGMHRGKAGSGAQHKAVSSDQSRLLPVRRTAEAASRRATMMIRTMGRTTMVSRTTTIRTTVPTTMA